MHSAVACSPALSEYGGLEGKSHDSIAATAGLSYILKPVASSRGRGVRLVPDPRALDLASLGECLLCRYVTDPYLVNVSVGLTTESLPALPAVPLRGRFLPCKRDSGTVRLAQIPACIASRRGCPTRSLTPCSAAMNTIPQAQGYKFDLRVYVAVTSLEPLRVYVHEEGEAAARIFSGWSPTIFVKKRPQVLCLRQTLHACANTHLLYMCRC